MRSEGGAANIVARVASVGDKVAGEFLTNGFNVLDMLRLYLV
jgi:hypothetical protein